MNHRSTVFILFHSILLPYLQSQSTLNGKQFDISVNINIVLSNYYTKNNSSVQTAVQVNLTQLDSYPNQVMDSYPNQVILSPIIENQLTPTPTPTPTSILTPNESFQSPSPPSPSFILDADYGYLAEFQQQNDNEIVVFYVTVRITPLRCSEVDDKFKQSFQRMLEFSNNCVGCWIIFSEECIEGELTSYEFKVFVNSNSGDDAKELSQKVALRGVQDYNLNFTVNALGLSIEDGFVNNFTVTETPGEIPENETITVEIEAPEETCPLFAYESIAEGCEEVVLANITLVVDEYRPWDPQFAATSVGGVRIPEIIGGVSVSFERYPYMMSLQTPTFPEGCFDAFCGATLIAPNLVLTAAHCLLYGGGTPDTREPGIELYAVKSPRCRHEGNNETRSEVIYQYVHPDFAVSQTDGSFSFDVAILQIADNFSAPYINIDASKNYNLKNDQILSIIGYGATTDPNADPLGEGGIYVKTKLQKGEVIYQNNTQCQNLVQEIYNFPPDIITPEILCADTFEPQIVDTCVGDSGGPMFVESNEPTKDIQLGITSYGFPYFDVNLGVTFDCGGTTVYTRIDEVLAWIYETVPEVVPLQQNLTRIFIEPFLPI